MRWSGGSDSRSDASRRSQEAGSQRSCLPGSSIRRGQRERSRCRSLASSDRSAQRGKRERSRRASRTGNRNKQQQEHEQEQQQQQDGRAQSTTGTAGETGTAETAGTGRTKHRARTAMNAEQFRHSPRSGPMPGASTGVTDWRGEMRYTSLGKVGGLARCLEALHLLCGVAGHSLERDAVLHDAQIAMLDEDLDDLAPVR